ncbi:MAG: HEAT repeat domain-containing protein, partial [Gemmatimonadetes bacterium]|nr:HEAT repeat domain-containing protein [Gemmatimonadota bacterium]
MTTPSAGMQAIDDDFDGQVPAALVEDALRATSKALKARQLYPGNNPTWLKAVDVVQGAFRAMWPHDDEVTLTISETEIRYGPHVVYNEGGKGSDSLAWIFYKDGVRALSLSRDVEVEEWPKVIELLPRVRRGGADDDDLLTLLWEGGFGYLKYRYVEIGGDGPAFDDQMGAPTRWSDDPVGRAQRARAALSGAADTGEGGGGGGGEGTGDGDGDGEAEERKSGVVNLADFDSSLYFLDETELDTLRRAFAHEYTRDHRQTVLAMLLDTFELQPEPDVRDEICDLLEQFVLTLLTSGDLTAVAYVLREAQAAASRAPGVQPAHRDRLAKLPDRLSEPAALAQVLQGLDATSQLPSAEEINALFDQLRVTALGTVLAWLHKLEQPTLRTLLEGAADRIARSNTIELVRLIGSSERLVALEAIRRSGSLKTAAAVAPMGKLLADGDAEVRAACVAALAEIGSAGAMQLIERALTDADRDVRVAAARAVTAVKYRASFNRLDGVLKGKELKDRDKTEMMAFYEAYGATGGDGAVAHLDAMLNGKGFLGRREDAEVRVCAAAGLGRVGTPKAQV